MTMSFGPSGAMVALLTPLDADGRLDEHGLERLVERVVAAGIDGISPNGSTGEGARLGRQRRIAVATRVRKLSPDGMPVVSGVPLTTLDEGRAELDDLAELGATAALVAPPSYYPLPDESVLRMYDALAGDAPLPLLLYNIPIFTKVRLAPGVVARLATHPAIAGINPEQITFYSRRIMVVPSGKVPGMAVWRERLFAAMHLNANLPAAYFGVPTSQVVEVGLEVEI